MTIITFISLIYIYIGSCPGRWSCQSHSWRGWHAPSALTNTSWIARPCGALSVAAFLSSSSNASACNGAASSRVNSKYCLWPGWATTRTKNSWVWSALHAGWTACGWNVVAWYIWCPSHWVEAKCRGPFQKSQWGFCLPHTWHSVTGGGQKAPEHHHKCIYYVSYVFY